MHNKISTRAVIALSLLIGAPAVTQAQTAAQYNRAAQAIQLCASSAGAMVPECAQLRGGLVAAPTPGAANALSGLLGGGGSGKAAAAAGLLGMATQALAAQRPPASPQPAPTPAPTAAGFPAMHTGDYYTATALATQSAAQAYQACVMRVGPANAAGVQGCIAQLGAASTGGASTGFPGVAQPAPAATALGSAAASAFSAMLGGR
jgi:hypothetical protein